MFLLPILWCWKPQKPKMEIVFEANEFQNDIETYVNEALRTKPFDESNDEFVQARDSDNIVDLAVFLVKNGYDTLYMNIQSCALELRRPHIGTIIVSRLERAHILSVTVESTTTFDAEEDSRNRPKDLDLRIEEVNNKFPKRCATRKQIKCDIKCVICQYNVKHKQHIRTLTCCGGVFHRKCIDKQFEFKPTCPLCRAVVLDS